MMTTSCRYFAPAKGQQTASLLFLLKFCFILTAFLYGPQAQACSCTYAGEFLEYAQKRGVIRARVLRLGPKLDQDQAMYGDNREYMDVQVIDVLRGEYSEVVMRLHGDNGAQCLHYVNTSIFRPGSEYIIAFSGQSIEQHLGGCGESYVRVENERVYGKRHREGGRETYDYDLTAFIEMVYRLDEEKVDK